MKLEIRYRTPAGAARNARLLELNEDGCRFFQNEGRLVAGTELSLTLGTVGPVEGKVIYSGKQSGGLMVEVAFARPLYGPVLEHLRTQIGPAD